MSIKFSFRGKRHNPCMPLPLPRLSDAAANSTPHLILVVSGILEQVLVNLEQRQDEPQEMINPSRAITHSSNPALTLS